MEPSVRSFPTDVPIRVVVRFCAADSSTDDVGPVMANALFLDYSISVADDAHGSISAGNRSTTVNVISDATGARRDELRKFFDGLIRLTDTDLRTVEAVVSRLVEVEPEEAKTSSRELLDDDNRRLRDRFIAELSPLRREDVLRLAEGRGGDGATTLHKWIDDGDIFSVTHFGREYYPAFQFANGEPKPVIGQLLNILRPELSAWQRAFWFVSANGWLSGRAPADVLDQEEVLDAARRDLEPLIG